MNRTGGVVTTTVMGVAALVIAVIVAMVIIGTIDSANLLTAYTDTNSSTNVTITSVNNSANASFGDHTKPAASCGTPVFTNASGGELISSGNYTVVGCLVQVSPTGDEGLNLTSWNVTVTTTYTGAEEQTVDDLRTNMTEGIGNVGEKIPTILLIVAVVFLFGALVLLIRNANQMGVGGSGGGSL